MQGGKRFFTFLLAAILAIGCGFGGGIAAIGYARSNNVAIQPEETGKIGGTTAVSNGDTTQGTTVQQITINPPDMASLGEAIAAKVMPSVVGIEVSYEVSMGGSYWYFGFGGRGGTSEATAQGTGIIVDEAGYILTNSHVVNDGTYKKVSVLLYDGRELEGEVLWNDPTLDLAIVKITADDLVAAELGDSDEIQIGSYAAALGNPLGLQFKFSMSQGVISGLDRTITVSSDGTSTNTTTMEGLIQTDAAINSGNSGGALVNSKGLVIGVNSAKAADGESMGFAIPINVAKPIVKQVKESGKFTRAYIGIKGIGLEEIGQYDSQTLKERFGAERGIYVSSVIEGGGAEAAGLKEKDVIISVNGTAVGTMNKINSILVGFNDGDTVTVEYIRDGQTYKADVKLSAQ